MGKEVKEVKVETIGQDTRFPNQNQTYNCFGSYVNFHRCQKMKGEGFETCKYFQRVYKTLCPNAWISHWDEQLKDGTFPGKI